MDAGALIARLEPVPEALRALLADLPDADWRWRPPEGGWSLLEVVHHLADEEVEDFRARLASVLEDPKRPWAKLDPEGAVVSRRANEADPRDVLERFRTERRRSLDWLAQVAAPRWESAYAHPKGSIAAGDLLASWVAHDARHLEQIAKRLHGLAARDGAPYAVGYAG
jgi:hypothetical protein